MTTIITHAPRRNCDWLNPQFTRLQSARTIFSPDVIWIGIIRDKTDADPEMRFFFNALRNADPNVAVVIYTERAEDTPRRKASSSQPEMETRETTLRY